MGDQPRRDKPLRDKPWIFRTYAGHSTAAASNALYRKNLSKGQTGLSVAFDLPTQTGYDSDHPQAKGEVGKVGVPISHLGDMRALFDGIPLDEMNTSMTINATAAWLLALYIAVADEQGVPRAKLQGTTQNDIIKEYLSRGTYVFPPAPSMRLIKDTILFTTSEMPKWNPMNVCSYHLQEAGATPEQELAFALATAIGVLDTVKARAGRRRRFRRGGRTHLVLRQRLARFVTEICKMRAFAELWDEITRERYGVTDAKQRLFRYGVQVNSLGLTEQQPENNVYRILLVDAGGDAVEEGARARAVQLPAWNEALGLPRPWDQQWSLRMQQILAYETDLLEYGDIFDGSAGSRPKSPSSKARRWKSSSTSSSWAAPSPRSRSGYMKRPARRNAIRARARGDRTQRTDRRRRQPLHRNRAVAAHRRGEDTIMTVSHEVEAGQIARLNAWRAARDGKAVAAALEALRARGQERRQHHAAVDRLRQSRRHHRRMGLCAALRVRRIPRADRRRQRHAQRHRRASTISAPRSTACRRSSAGA